MSAVIPVQVNIKDKAMVAFLADLAVNQRDTIKFIWENTTHSNLEILQIASNQNFSNLPVHRSNINDKFKKVTGLNSLLINIIH